MGKGDGDDSGARAAAEANRLSQQGIDELRRQFDITQANIDPFIQAGAGQIGALEEGTSVQGFADRLARIFESGALDSLIEERTGAVRGGLAAAGLTRSGTAVEELSAIPQNIGFGIENLLFGRSANLAAGGQNAALGLGGIGAQTSGNIANLFSRQGANLIGGFQQDAQSRGGFLSDVLGFGGAVAGGIGAAGGFGEFFSDRDLKENIEPIGKIGPLTIHQWDWIPKTKDMFISKFPTMGFIADEVKEHFPEFVSELDGYAFVDYGGLLNVLEGDLVLEGVA